MPSKEIFDQDRPRSTLARRLDEAFAGCDQWSAAPPTQRRSETTLSPWPSSFSKMTGNAAAVSIQEPPAL
jgi:hypothetical protein